MLRRMTRDEMDITRNAAASAMAVVRPSLQGWVLLFSSKEAAMTETTMSSHGR
jgi:hypothetical protein